MKDNNQLTSNADLRAGIYARVSSNQQAKASTINSQTQSLKDRTREDGHALEEEYCFVDDGYSGATRHVGVM